MGGINKRFIFFTKKFDIKKNFINMFIVSFITSFFWLHFFSGFIFIYYFFIFFEKLKKNLLDVIIVDICKDIINWCLISVISFFITSINVWFVFLIHKCQYCHSTC